MDYWGYGYERIDGGITGHARQMAIDRFNGTYLVLVETKRIFHFVF